MAKRGMGWRKLAVWGGAAMLLLIFGLGLLNSNKSRPEVGTQAPDFEMTFFNGYEWQNLQQANLSDLRGNVVIMNFWASWCVECRLEAELLQATSQKYADDGVVFLGIAWTDTKPKSYEYMQAFNITYPNAPDLGLQIGAAYEITGIPETFFINKSGEIAHIVIGLLSEEALNSAIVALLEQ